MMINAADCLTTTAHRWLIAWLRTVLLGLLVMGLTGGCAGLRPATVPTDPESEAVLAQLKHANSGLSQFKCVGRLTLKTPNQPAQSFRAAVAGQIPDRLRIDLFSPFGGSSATLASDGEHLFVVQHASQEYRKKTLGQGSLRRIVGLDVSVAELLELMVGRLPLEAGCAARRSSIGTDSGSQLDLIDRRGRVRQRITLDADRQPKQSAWFDTGGKPVYTLVVSGWQVVDGFALPRKLELSKETGQRVTVGLDRYVANAPMSDGLFTPAPPPF
ncbi:hypothetical protein DSCO28_02480 [Desulfosarcina ovata subsp. sediminis]|uniref:Outer-membrane lipoprotein LolB n=1 Tax=Desulfosarcina ovata subsp. sediminis TaxID=885957 RepID=A0A5K7ZCG8_9BACT|nr:lipoprotein insertase outer membrane protein LolB [Desulfosarcina ovata]BBO79682.1 hypothetical protein DSCO28_02480 [Desulfosarcina ovata subsp. sediminis]